MKKVFIATTNQGKLKEAQQILKIDVEGTPLQIDEIQSLNYEEVAIKKARAYFKELKFPVFVDDASLTFTALNGLPGTYTGDFVKALGIDGMIALLANKKDRSAVAKVVIAFIDEDETEHIFIGEIEGEITTEPKGNNGFGWDPIFIPKGFNKTFAEMTDDEKNSCSMRKLALEKLYSWLSAK